MATTSSISASELVARAARSDQGARRRRAGVRAGRAVARSPGVSSPRATVRAPSPPSPLLLARRAPSDSSGTSDLAAARVLAVRSPASAGPLPAPSSGTSPRRRARRAPRRRSPRPACRRPRRSRAARRSRTRARALVRSESRDRSRDAHRDLGSRDAPQEHEELVAAEAPDLVVVAVGRPQTLGDQERATRRRRHGRGCR